MAPRWERLARLDEVPVGESKGFDPHGEGRDSLFVVRTGEAFVVAYRNACPHVSGARMAWKKDRFMSGDGRHIACFAHGALFRPKDGLCVSGPCQGQYLTAVEVAIRGEELYLRLDNLCHEGVMQSRKELEAYEKWNASGGEIYTPTEEEMGQFRSYAEPIEAWYLENYGDDGKKFLAELDAARERANSEVKADRESTLE